MPRSLQPARRVEIGARCASSSARGLRVASRASRSRPKRLRGAWPMKMFSATRQLVEQHRFLVDRGDAGRAGVVRRWRRCTGCAVERMLARVGLVDAGQDLDQRRLAGAVLADQRRHLAGVERRGDTSCSARTPGKLFEMPAERRGSGRLRRAWARPSAADASSGDRGRCPGRPADAEGVGTVGAAGSRAIRRSWRTPRRSTCRR